MGEIVRAADPDEVVVGSFRSFPFVIGLSAGLLSGFCYAYAYSYGKHCGYQDASQLTSHGVA